MEKRRQCSRLPKGPKEPRSTVLILEEEASCIAFHKHTLLPLWDKMPVFIKWVYPIYLEIKNFTHAVSRLCSFTRIASPIKKEVHLFVAAYPIFILL